MKASTVQRWGMAMVVAGAVFAAVVYAPRLLEENPPALPGIGSRAAPTTDLNALQGALTALGELNRDAYHVWWHHQYETFTAQPSDGPLHAEDGRELLELWQHISGEGKVDALLRITTDQAGLELQVTACGEGMCATPTNSLVGAEHEPQAYSPDGRPNPAHDLLARLKNPGRIRYFGWVEQVEGQELFFLASEMRHAPQTEGSPPVPAEVWGIDVRTGQQAYWARYELNPQGPPELVHEHRLVLFETRGSAPEVEARVRDVVGERNAAP
jgi:hypothetical protein